MAAELQVNNASGTTTYALIRTATGTIWNGTSFVTYSTPDYATSYKVAMTEQGSASGYFTATFPSTTAGVYNIVYKQQAGGSPAEADMTIAIEEFHWDGVLRVGQNTLSTSGQVGTYLPQRIFRGQSISNFPFKLVSSSDHVTSFTSGIISGQISRDGGAFGVLQSGTLVAGYSEIGRGWFSVNLTSGDMLANTIALSFVAVGVSGGSADQRDFGFLLQRVSGQGVT